MASAGLRDLIAAVRREAEAAGFPIDLPVYTKSGREPSEPILFAGSLEAPICIVGRDLGKDEVAAGEPLIGAAGRLVRIGILAARGESVARPDAPALERALRHVLLTNTVPYKPPGNKAYPESVRRLFRPYLARLLVEYWRGRHLITLGTEAFRWFEPYADPADLAARGGSEQRFESVFACRVVEASPSRRHIPDKEVRVFPLPHPSPLNRRWYDQFPAMLARRLAEIDRDLEDIAKG